ncbi:MAG TPA: hypothetical protein VGN11_06770 [Candidatus Baltobacteraceae bacterium]|nr:hypothetical protein [Candidatus Baltobacteraceae bacterium]
MKPFGDALLQWYARNGRSHLPWRTRRDAYYTVVSEYMLQQTQVDRVLPKFEAFIVRYPDVRALARASTAGVIRIWQGLGYNSRAVRLLDFARAVVEKHGGEIPSETEALRSLPGVGPYTAAAVRAFGFNLDDAAMDTNVRRIVHRVCFGVEVPPKASLPQLDAKARELVPAGMGHDWNSAVMDLGATICTARAPKCLVCPLRTCCAAAPLDSATLDRLRRAHSKPPSPQNAVPFVQTTRYLRGRIVERLRALPAGARISLLDLHRDLAPVLPDRSFDDVTKVADALERDGLIARDGETVALKD